MKNQYRFFIDTSDMQGGSFVSQDKALANQLKNVLRLRSGANIVVLDGTGFEYLVQLRNLTKDRVEAVVVSKERKDSGSPKISLFCSALKGDHFEMVLEKCTELGVTDFFLVAFDNSIIKDVGESKMMRYNKIVKEASEQSGRTSLPVVHAPITFNKVMGAVGGENNLAADILSDKNILQVASKNMKSANIFIGPEGDFSDEEKSIMRRHGFVFFNLGQNILRSETACIISSGIISQIMLK